MANFTIPVTEYMVAPVHTVRTADELERARLEMAEHGVGALAVVADDGALAGVISRTDLLRVGRAQAGRAMKASLLTLPHREVQTEMTAEVVTVTLDTALDQAAKLMIERRIHRVFVEKDGQPVGVLSTQDLMRAVFEKRVNNPLSEFMASPVFTVRAAEPISLATERLERARVSGLVVVDETWPVGVFAQREALLGQGLARDTAVEEAMNPAILCLSGETRVFRAAQQALAMSVRRVIAVKNERAVGIVSGLDFARVVC